MDGQTTARLIDAAGGDTAFGKLLGIGGEAGFQQRVNNWRRRGLPAAVALEHYDVVKKLHAKIGRGRAR
ncbi:MAG TPA: hypothetical protein VGF89_01145 [Steroidobacteraceae bacterium]|jgi:hypothetical protein